MDRRTMIERLFFVFTLGGLLLFTGCEKKEKPSGFGNQGKLWQVVVEERKSEEPVELEYTKETPALYRDASMGKADPSFVPRVGGG
jgi:hypothetical protein